MFTLLINGIGMLQTPAVWAQSLTHHVTLLLLIGVSVSGFPFCAVGRLILLKHINDTMTQTLQ